MEVLTCSLAGLVVLSGWGGGLLAVCIKSGERGRRIYEDMWGCRRKLSLGRVGQVESEGGRDVEGKSRLFVHNGGVK